MTFTEPTNFLPAPRGIFRFVFFFAMTILLATAAGPAAIAQETAAETEKSADGSDEKIFEGQADLDEAIIDRIDAETPQALEAVAALLESAISKGLDEENKAFARKMLGSVLVQRAQGLIARLPAAQDGRPGLSRRQGQLRDEALELLDEAVEQDASLVDAHLLIARLNLLPGADRQAARQAATVAIELLSDNPKEQAAAYVLRALINEEDHDKLADLDEALKIDPKHRQAIQMRAGLRLESGDIEGAIGDLEQVLLEDPTNQEVAGRVVQRLVELERLEEAKGLITKLLAAQPSEGMYRMRAILHRANDDLDDAKSDLDKAISMAPKDPLTLLQRAQLALDRDDIKSAKTDFRTALEVVPQLANSDPGIEMRMLIAIGEKRMADAINDAKVLVDRAPADVFRRIRLASLYTIDERPRLAIDVLTSVLADEPKNVAVLRSRGDALLSVGDHTAAIEDYESAIAAVGNLDPKEATPRELDEASGLYNNLSWVLATSPKDAIRNGSRALELAVKSAELTEYKAPHILSTLAAAHAEQGQFEEARKWSKKAVDLAAEQEHDQLEQLQEELESYEKDEPWRELQDVQENDVPILSPEDLIDT